EPPVLWTAVQASHSASFAANAPAFRSDPLVIVPRASEDRPCEEHVRRAIRRLAERHETPGALADPGLFLAWEHAQRVFAEFDPASRDRAEFVVCDASDRADPGRVDAFDRPIVGF